MKLCGGSAFLRFCGSSYQLFCQLYSCCLQPVAARHVGCGGWSGVKLEPGARRGGASLNDTKWGVAYTGERGSTPPEFTTRRGRAAPRPE
jgi:hypothetical protein